MEVCSSGHVSRFTAEFGLACGNRLLQQKLALTSILITEKTTVLWPFLSYFLFLPTHFLSCRWAGWEDMTWDQVPVLLTDFCASMLSHSAEEAAPLGPPPPLTSQEKAPYLKLQKKLHTAKFWSTKYQDQIEQCIWGQAAVSVYCWPSWKLKIKES